MVEYREVRAQSYGMKECRGLTGEGKRKKNQGNSGIGLEQGKQRRVHGLGKGRGMIRQGRLQSYDSGEG